MFDSFGTIFRLTDCGDTHGEGLWGLIEGCPQGISIDLEFLAEEMQRRSPSRQNDSTQRREPDQVEFLTGIGSDGKTDGEPIRFQILNHDVKVNEHNRHLIRPSHSSYVYFKKYGYTDNEQCGRSSARQSVCRVVAGVIAKLFLRQHGIVVSAKTLSTATPKCDGDSAGALVEGSIKGLPAGLGEPVYDKFSARLAYAMLSINAARGFEFGEGFAAANMTGSEYNDLQNPDFTFQSNHDGGVQAGITNGEDVTFKVAFKPIPSVRFDQRTIDFDGNPAILKGSNRNDLCVAPRVLPIVEAMAAMVVMDFMLIEQKNKLNKQHNEQR